MSAIARYILIALLLGLSGLSSAATPTIGDIAPGWTAPGPDGRKLTFAEGPRERPAILLFWATWCPYCKALMPHLQSVLEDAAEGAVDIYALDIFEDEPADPAAELRRRGQDFILVAPADEVAKQYDVKGTPSLFLIGRDGRISYVRPNGARPEEVEAALRQMLRSEARSANHSPARAAAGSRH